MKERMEEKNIKVKAARFEARAFILEKPSTVTRRGREAIGGLNRHGMQNV